MTMRSRWAAWVLVGAIVTGGFPSVLVAAPPEASDDAGDRSRAVEFYSRGDFATARTLLEKIDAAGKADGALLYRLSYCQRVAGDAQSAQSTQQRAKGLLEQEVAASGTLEAPFYLVNIYQNLGLDADMRRVAAETVARVERGEISTPESGIDMFRLGKMYADQGVEKKALEWYSRTVDAMESEGGSETAYLRRASRYIADRAFRAKDFVAAQRHYTVLFENGEGSASDLDRLAVSRARLGMYEEAALAWRESERLDPADSNRARYCYNLAAQAAGLGELPATAPSGQIWADMDKTGLEALMKEQAAKVKEIKAEVQAAGTLTTELRAELRKRIRAVKPIFVAAALEYAARGYSIRETAFFGGYAPLIFRKSAWHLGKPATEGQPAAKESESGTGPGL